VKRGLLGGGEHTGGLDNVGSASLGPGDAGGVALLVELDALAVDDEVLAVDLDGALELAVLGVILEHVGLWLSVSCFVMNAENTAGGVAESTYSVVSLNERVVDSDNVSLAVLEARTGLE
jgi:hypothetical protein